MRSRRFRRRALACALGAMSLVSTACFGGGGGNQPAAQTTATVAPVSTAAQAVASPPTRPSPSPAVSPSGSPTVPRADGTEQNYTVETGDTLATIAQKFYDDPTAWRKIYEAN